MAESEIFLDKILTYVDDSDKHFFRCHKADIKAYAKLYYKEQLTLTDVSQQRELLLDFLKWQSIAYSCNNDEIGNAKEVEAFFKSKNCG